MLRELVQAAERFQREGTLLPESYKRKAFRWVIDIDQTGHGDLLGPYDRDTFTRPAPDRQRSGRPSETNLKPFLLADDARYALGIAEPGREGEAQLLHNGFIALVRKAFEETGEMSLAPIIRFLDAGVPEDIREQVRARDLVIFRHGDIFPTDRDVVQRFWADYVGEETAAEIKASCAVCGRLSRLVQILPQEVVVLGQKCQITSFNLAAFESFGKKQTTNAPLCAACSTSAIAALQQLLKSARHRAVLVRGRREASPLQNHVAVFWLKERAEALVEGERFDYEEALAAILIGGEMPVTAPAETEAEALDKLERLLRLPWEPKPHVLRLEDNVFHMAVLSANKGRLVVREWLAVPLARVRDNLAAFLDALRLVQPDGSTVRAVSLPRLLASLRLATPHETRALLRTAYLGMPPASGLLEVAVRLLRIPKMRNNEEVLHALMAAIKLVRTYRTEEARTMEKLDLSHRSPAYLAGRLLAVLEEAQRRAATGRLNTTVVDSFYGAAATAPVVLANLVKRARTAHFPKLRRDGRGGDLERLIDEILVALQPGDLPRTLTLEQQADFALGYHHQRAALRARRAQPAASPESVAS